MLQSGYLEDIKRNTVEPPVSTTSAGDQFPKQQKFPIQINISETSTKRAPLVSDRDHFKSYKFEILLIFFCFDFNLP